MNPKSINLFLFRKLQNISGLAVQSFANGFERGETKHFCFTCFSDFEVAIIIYLSQRNQTIMAKIKTIATEVNVTEFIQKVANEVKRKDSFQLVEIFKSITGCDAKMWGPTIIGFGNYHYKYESGHEGDMPIAAFSPRKEAIVFYFADFENRAQLLEKLGKHKSGKACVYVKKLEDINLSVLEELTRASIKYITSKYLNK